MLQAYQAQLLQLRLVASLRSRSATNKYDFFIFLASLVARRLLQANDAHVKSGQFVCEGLENNRVMLESGVRVHRLVCKPATYELLEER